MKKFVTYFLLPFVFFIVTMGVSLTLLSSIVPSWMILIVCFGVTVALTYLSHQDPVVVAAASKITTHMTVRSAILLTVSLAGLCVLTLFLNRIAHWFLSFKQTLFVSTGLWAYYFWWKYGENWFRYTEQNTLEISGNALIKNIDPEKSQRTLFAGINLMLPGIDNVDGSPISTKWIQIELSEKFSAQSLDGVEVSFEGCFQRMRILGDEAVAFNNHGVEEATKAFVARMEAFLTNRIALIYHDDIRSMLELLCSEFAAVYPPSNRDSLESIYGVQTKEIQISGVIFPTEVEASNRLGMIMKVVSKQAQKIVELSGESIKWKEALFYVMSMMGKMTGDLGIFAAFGNMFGNKDQNNNNKEKQNQGQEKEKKPSTKPKQKK